MNVAAAIMTCGLEPASTGEGDGEWYECSNQMETVVGAHELSYQVEWFADRDRGNGAMSSMRPPQQGHRSGAGSGRRRGSLSSLAEAGAVSESSLRQRASLSVR
jgi:hypothetical protein